MGRTRSRTWEATTSRRCRRSSISRSSDLDKVDDSRTGRVAPTGEQTLLTGFCADNDMRLLIRARREARANDRLALALRRARMSLTAQQSVITVAQRTQRQKGI